MLLCVWKHLEGKVVDVSGLKAGAERWVQRVSFVSGNGKSKSNDSKILTYTNNFPRIQLIFSVLLLKST